MWGLMTNTDIPKNTYIFDYLGEVITREEADNRGQSKDKKTGRAEGDSYLFDLCNYDEIDIEESTKNDDNYKNKETMDIIVDEQIVTIDKQQINYIRKNKFPLVIDSYFFGNLSRFINHSCEPNLRTLAIHNHNRDPMLGKISFFAIRDILKGEELTVDYNWLPLSNQNNSSMPCLCGSKKCRQNLFQEKE